MNMRKKIVGIALCGAMLGTVAFAKGVEATATNALLPEGFDTSTAQSGKAGAAAKGKPAMQKVLSAEGLALKGDIKVEYGEGHGETIDEALKEAMKDVLQKVVGVYVDSDFRMNNDEIIKDEIITHSNGFIDHYNKIEETNDANGRGKSVTIKAWVKMRDFVNRMKKIAPSQTMEMDGAIIENELSNKINAETLLKKEFENFNPAEDLLDVNLVANIRPAVRDSTDETVTLRYVFQVRYAKAKYYQTFLPRITRVLDQIAEATPHNRNVSLKVEKVKLILADDKETWRERTVPGTFLKMEKDFENKRETMCLHAITAVNGKSATVREWKLSERLINIYKACHAKSFSNCKELLCVLVLSDVNGGILAQATTKMRDRWYVPYADVPYPKYEVPKRIDFAPFMGGLEGCYDLSGKERVGHGWSCDWYDRYVGFIDITIDHKNVAKIKTAKVSLETNNQGENE